MIIDMVSAMKNKQSIIVKNNGRGGPTLERMVQDCLSEELILSQSRENLGDDFRHREEQMQKP